MYHVPLTSSAAMLHWQDKESFELFLDPKTRNESTFALFKFYKTTLLFTLDIQAEAQRPLVL